MPAPARTTPPTPGQERHREPADRSKQLPQAEKRCMNGHRYPSTRREFFTWARLDPMRTVRAATFLIIVSVVTVAAVIAFLVLW